MDISSGYGEKTNCVWTFLYKLRHFHKDKLGFQNQLLDLLSKAYWVAHNSILYYKKQPPDSRASSNLKVNIKTNIL